MAATACVLALGLAGCAALGPDHARPGVAVPPTYKEPAPGWLAAAPADAVDRGDWWTLFNEPGLDVLMPQVAVSNQTVAAALAALEQAQALVRAQRAALFPSVALDASQRRSGGESRSGATGARGTSSQLALGATWVPDLWGQLRRAVEGAAASAQASEAQLAAAELAARGELATNYVSLRATDAQIELLRRTVEGYERSLAIARNRYEAGIAARTDVLQAQTQLATTRADLATLRGQRAQLEHAIAVLLGRPPAALDLPEVPWNQHVPRVPVGVPSTLLQRRPDIAAAERAVAAANAQVGVQRAAGYPALTLTGTAGVAASRVADLFSASASLWSLGLSAAQVLFDAGAIGARVDAARAAHAAEVANYRQIVLLAFQEVEDQLALSRVLAEQAGLRREASEAADLSETQMLNRYRQGQVGYTEVVTAQAAALAARRALAQSTAARQASAVALIQALGGGWHAPPGFDGANTEVSR